MKRFLAAILVLSSILLSSCSPGRINPNIAKTGINKQEIERVAITNNRYFGRYTIIDKKGIDRFKNSILRAKDVSKSNGLEPDFIFDLYSGTQKVATFKYIASIDDKDTANLIDEQGKLYHMNTSIEDEFIKRIMKKDRNENVPEYYISLIGLIIEKTNVSKGNTVAVDLSKDYFVTSSLLSVDQKRIFDSVGRGVSVVSYDESKTYDYVIKINTENYSDNSCNTTVSVRDRKGIITKYDIVGSFERGKWNYHIKFD